MYVSRIDSKDVVHTHIAARRPTGYGSCVGKYLHSTVLLFNFHSHMPIRAWQMSSTINLEARRNYSGTRALSINRVLRKVAYPSSNRPMSQPYKSLCICVSALQSFTERECFTIASVAFDNLSSSISGKFRRDLLKHALLPTDPRA